MSNTLYAMKNTTESSTTDMEVVKSSPKVTQSSTAVKNYPLWTKAWGNRPAPGLSFRESLQTKLAVNQPGDRHEQEADRKAEQVMQMPAPALPASNHPANQAGHSHLPLVAQGVVQSAGQPLSTSTRAFMEPRFGYDFSDVRIHADAEATESVRSLNALAYTMGRDIFFDAQQFSPETTIGRQLLAHELTHVVQQKQNGSPAGTIQRKIKMKEAGKTTWHELTLKERRDFLERHFKAGHGSHLAKRIIEDMADAGDDFKFDDVSELFHEISKRMKTSQFMRESQRDFKAFGAFGYPDREFFVSGKGLGPRVNKAAKKYWGPVQDAQGDYFFELKEEGRKNAFQAIKSLFTPQHDKRDRTLIHCDYLASVVHFRAFAEIMGIKEFNNMVKAHTIPLKLKWNGFMDIEPMPLRSKKQTSLQEVRPSSERDLVIGDHVIFWNHLAYDLINAEISDAWRLENAILVDKRKDGKDMFLGHGSGEKTNQQMREKLRDMYNGVVQRAFDLIKETKDKHTRAKALAQLILKFPYVKEVGTEWRVQGTAHSKTIDMKLEKIHADDKLLVGLRDPEDPTRMNYVKRPIESA